MNARAYLFVAVATSLIGCSASEPEREQGDRRWTCASLAVPNGGTTWCRSAEPVASASGAARPPQGATGEGTIAIHTYSTPPGTGSGSGSGAAPGADAGSPTSSPPSSQGEAEYECSAGDADCPPPGSMQESSDTTTSAPPGASSGTESYKCGREGGMIECARKELSCNPGTVPAPSGDRCVSSGGGADTTTPGTVTSNCFEVGLVRETKNANGSSTWTYRVRELPCAQDLSNWVLGTGACAITGGSPRYELVNPDPNAQLVGVKWETGGGFSDGEFTVTTTATRRGMIKFATKGPKVAYGTVDGPICD